MPHPRVFDGLQFSRSGSKVRGNLAGGDVPRLAELGCRVLDLSFAIEGTISSRDRPSLQVQASADVEVVCQRCLEPLAMHLPVDVELELSESELEIARAEDEVDRVLATPAMNVAQLVEDELILILPDTPKHEHCALASGREAGARSSPFETLARLKHGQ